MANAFYGHAYYCDTVGIISKTPITVKAICFYPNQQADAIQFNWWDEANPVATTKKFVPSITITGTTTITDADTGGVLTNAYADGDVLKLFPAGEFGGNGSAANHTYHLIAMAGDNNVIVTAASLTNEDTKSQKLESYPARVAFKFKQPNDTNERSMWFPFGGQGLRLPNLTLETISSTCSAVVYIA